MIKYPYSFLKLLLIILFIVNACGTRDYGAPNNKAKKSTVYEHPKEVEEPREFNEQKHPEIQTPTISQAKEKDLLFAQDVNTNDHDDDEGYLWGAMSWVGIPNEESLTILKSNLSDDLGASEFDILGTTFLGGALLAVVVQASGSTFFGGPVDTQASHWFWRGVQRAKKNLGRTIIRGGFFAGACQMVLTGNLLPFDGFLGNDYKTLSSAIVLGSMSSGATAAVMGRFANDFIHSNWADAESRMGKIFGQSKLTKSAIEKFQIWSNQSKLGKATRYRFLPGIAILGIGSGVGLVVYHSLQADDQENIDLKSQQDK